MPSDDRVPMPPTSSHPKEPSARTSPPSGITLTALGAGSAFTRMYGTTCSMLAVGPTRERWLVDCGRQAPDQLWSRGLSWWDISGQIVTHVHGDHAYGLEDFALMRYYGMPKYGRSILSGGAKPKLIAHTAVIEEIWQMLAPSLKYRTDAAGKPVDGTLGDYFDLVEAAGVEAPKKERWNHAESYATPELALIARESRHIPGKPSMSLEIAVERGSDKIAWWGGDCVVDPARLIELEPRVTVFFHDCTFVEMPGQVHGVFSELAKLPLSVREKTVLMHHDDDLADNSQRAIDLGFRILLPGHTYDLASGRLVASDP